MLWTWVWYSLVGIQTLLNCKTKNPGLESDLNNDIISESRSPGGQSDGWSHCRGQIIIV
jgi:hypothetical protein